MCGGILRESVYIGMRTSVRDTRHGGRRRYTYPAVDGIPVLASAKAGRGSILMLKGCLNNSEDALHHSNKLKRGHQHRRHTAPADPIRPVVSQLAGICQGLMPVGRMLSLTGEIHRSRSLYSTSVGLRNRKSEKGIRHALLPGVLSGTWREVRPTELDDSGAEARLFTSGFPLQEHLVRSLS